MDNDGKIINEFCSISEASDTIGVGYDSIKGVLQKKQKHAGGYCSLFLRDNMQVNINFQE